MTITRKQFTDRALKALATYKDDEETDTAIADLLCDLHHLCDQLEVDWHETNRRADGYYQEDNITYLEMARIAIATIPEDLAEEMDISDDELIRLRDQLHIHLDWEVKE
jgi:hypothetical protein